MILFSLIISTSLIIAQDADEILNRHYDAMGIDEVLKTNTLIAKGTGNQMGTEFPMTIYQKRPGKARMEAEIMGSELIQAYDGEKAWAIIPWTGSMDPQEMNEEQSKSMQQMADMEGDLYKWKEKGYQLNYLGEEDVEGNKVHRFKLEKDGNNFTYSLDSDTYLINTIETSATVNGSEVDVSTRYSDYRDVEGMQMPHSIESKVNGAVQSTIIIDSYEVGSEIEDSLFEMPASEME